MVAYITKSNRTPRPCYGLSTAKPLIPCSVCGSDVSIGVQSRGGDTCSPSCRAVKQNRLKLAAPSSRVAPPGSCWFPLTRGHSALIDAEDFDRLAVHSWAYVDRGPVATTSIGGKSIKMHHFLLGVHTEPGAVGRCKIDHRNGDSLDNRKSNLRAATQQENMHNLRKPKKLSSSRFKGVHRVRNHPLRPWASTMKASEQYLFLGYFATEEEAAHAYDAAARKHFGEFACVNFPLPGERSAI